MRAPLHAGRALLLLLALVACNADVDPPWQLEHDRIIAVRAEPPRILAGEQSRIDLLVGFDMNPVTERAPDIATVVSPMTLSGIVTSEGGHWIVRAPGEDQLAAARDELELPAGAPVPVRVGVAAAWPNPVMSIDGAHFGATKTVWIGESKVNPQLVGVQIGGVDDPPTDVELVVPADGETPLHVEADDSMEIVNWLTSAGEMHDFDLHAAYLTFGPEDKTEGELALVVRDLYGGVAWRVWRIRAE